MLYHYQESGLDNVFLDGGVIVHDTPCGEGTSIEAINDLHRAISAWIVETPAPITGAELCFLRTEMDLTQSRLAALLGATEQTLRLWEKHREKAIPGSADRLLRVIYSEHAGEGAAARPIVERLADLNQAEKCELRLTRTKTGWDAHALAVA